MMRYAIYYAPAPESLLWQAGCRWVGRDAVTGVDYPAPHRESLTVQARRYGFHATLKAPFRLRAGYSEGDLLEMAHAFAGRQSPVPLPGMQVRALGDFLALRPAGPEAEINALAIRCVRQFDPLRAPLTSAELEKRRATGLSPRQDALLQRWGYPYTESEFRFHMTLSDSLGAQDAHTVCFLQKAAEECFRDALGAGALTIDALTIFREPTPGAPFSVLQRIPFGARGGASVAKRRGRLFFLVGPSGVGKDTLLDWVRRHAKPASDIVFARRTITRPPHASESHDAIDLAGFRQRAAAGQFSMTWEANGLCYGVPRTIDADLSAGRHVVINGSRGFIPQLRRLYPDAQIIWVEAESAQIRKRIEARQREAGQALMHRIARIEEFAPPAAEGVIRIDNSGPIERAGKRLLEILS